MDKYLRAFAEINLDAIEHNFNEMKKCINDDVKICAVVKADAYGHGAVTVADTLKDKADYFAVATPDEAIELRKSGITAPVIILTYTHSDDYRELIENNVSMTVFTKEAADNLQKTASEIGKKALIHIAIDTGMTRLGFMPDDDSVEAIKYISALSDVEIQSIFSHYACADMKDKSVSEIQTKRFTDFIEKCRKAGINFPLHHICNSAGTSEFSENFDMVRMGISIYGLYPSDEIDMTRIDLVPAMTFKSHIVNVKEVPENVGISYGHTYTTSEKRTIATVAAGYADGYPRALSNCGKVIINGQYAPIVGRVCMDQFMIDVTGIDAKIDDEVILFGCDGNLTVSAEEIGEKSMSFNYEIICGIARRIPRVYKKDGKTIKTTNYLR